jgi:hypothetical protein
MKAVCAGPVSNSRSCSDAGIAAKGGKGKERVDTEDSGAMRGNAPAGLMIHEENMILMAAAAKRNDRHPSHPISAQRLRFDIT